MELIKYDCILSGHYTDTWTTETAKKLGHPIWSSEDYSHVDDENGAGCLARVRYIILWCFLYEKLRSEKFACAQITYDASALQLLPMFSFSDIKSKLCKWTDDEVDINHKITSKPI